MNNSDSHIHRIRPRGYPHNGEEWNHGHTTTPVRDGFLRVLGAVTTPLVPSDYLDVIDPLRSGAALRGRIEAITPETADAVTVVIRPGRGWLGHRARPVRPDRDRRRWRAAVAGLLVHIRARADGLIAITVKAIPDGEVSNHIVRRARAGTIIQLDQATGDFHLPAAAPQQGPVHHRWQRDHAGDGHAAPPTRRTGGRRRGCTAHRRPADVIFSAELGDMAAVRPDPTHRAAHGHRRAARPGRARRARARLDRPTDLGLRAHRPARRPRGAMGGRWCAPTGCTPSGSARTSW